MTTKNKPLTNGRGRIRCIGENDDWRDCGEWATRWVYAWAHWNNQAQYIPYCDHHAWDLQGVGVDDE